MNRTTHWFTSFCINCGIAGTVVIAAVSAATLIWVLLLQLD